MYHLFRKVLRTGLEGTTVESGVSAAGSMTPRGAGLGFNLKEVVPFVRPVSNFRMEVEVTCGSPMSEVRKSEVRIF
jgi:hypothetical protein